MKKRSTTQKLNLLFSAFLVFAFTVCSYFVESYSSAISNEFLRNVLPSLIFIIFGIFLFYATRVGDGKPVYRFSLAVLILMVLPGVYIFLASMAQNLPFSVQIQTYGVNMSKIACVMLGYGLPYMFISGFEMESIDASADDEIVEEAKTDADTNEKANIDTDIDEDVLENKTQEEVADGTDNTEKDE